MFDGRAWMAGGWCKRWLVISEGAEVPSRRGDEVEDTVLVRASFQLGNGW